MADPYHTERRSGGAGRTILIILVVAVLVVIVAFATGMINLSSTGGSLPKVEVEGGALPKVETKTETVKVPTLDVQKAN